MEVSSATIHPPLAGSEMSDHGGLPTRNICFQDRLPTGFSFIVDDVDGDIEPETEDEPEESAAVAPEAAASAAVTSESAAAVGMGVGVGATGAGCGGGGGGSGSSRGGSARVSRVPSREGSPGAKEETDARIRQMQTEAESRKNEFARLLEEHAQVIQQLKQMEHDPAPGALAAAGATPAAPAPAPAGPGGDA